MAHLVVDHLDPFALAEVDASAFPVFRMDEVDAAVFVSAAGGFAPIDVLEPFDAWASHVEVAAHRGDGAIETGGAVAAEKFGEVAINFAAMSDRRNNHSHSQATSGDDKDHMEGRSSESNTVGKFWFIPAFDCKFA